MVEEHSDQTAFVCDLTALNAEQRKRYEKVREQLNILNQEVMEVPDGYSFRYPVDASVISLLAEFIDLEDRCCPFLNFTLDVKTEVGPAWLTLTGPEGVKEFLRAELSIDENLS